jgi:hypothetical protein
MRLISLAILTFWLSVTSALIGQDKAFPSKTSSAPRMSGRLIGTQGTRQLILEYQRAAGKEVFIGKVQSTCRVPAKGNPAETTPIELSGIPKGSQVTVFYVRHARKIQGTERVENVILALRLDRLNGTFSVPVGETIPCYESGPTPSPK